MCFSSLVEGEGVTQEGTAEERKGLGLSQAWPWGASLTEMFLNSYLEAGLQNCRPASQNAASLRHSAYEPTELGQMPTANTTHALKQKCEQIPVRAPAREATGMLPEPCVSADGWWATSLTFPRLGFYSGGFINAHLEGVSCLRET